MAESYCARFPPRHNRDGTIDSICTRCFETIATTTDESDLQKPEESHICTRLHLSQISYPPPGRIAIGYRFLGGLCLKSAKYIIANFGEAQSIPFDLAHLG